MKQEERKRYICDNCGWTGDDCDGEGKCPQCENPLNPCR